MAVNIKERLILNTFFGLVGLGFSRVIGLVLTPYVLYKLGVEQFALWSLVQGILGYLSKADMGVSTAYARYIAQFYAKHDYERLNKVLNTGFFFYIGVGCLVASCALLGGKQIFVFFRLEQSIQLQVQEIFRYLVLLQVCSLSLGVFGSVLEGVQRSDLLKKIQIGLCVVDAIGKVVFLEAGYQLHALLLTDILTGVLRMGCYAWFAYQSVPELRLTPRLFDKPLFRDMFSYGIHLQIGRIAKISQMHLSKLILARFAPLASIAVYDLGNRAALSVQSIPLALSPAIIPAASHLHSLGDRALLHRLYDRASKYMAILVMYVVGFFFCMMPVVFLSWTGQQIDVAQASLIARIIMLGAAYFLLADITSVLVLGLGHPEYSMRAAIITLVANVSLNLALIPTFGFVGAALATSCAEIAGRLYLVIAGHQELQRSYWDVVKRLYAIPLLAGGLAYFMTWGAKTCFIAWILTPQTRPENLLLLSLMGLVFTAIYGLILLKACYLHQEDFQLVMEYYHKLKLRVVPK